jgi:bifunctional UDP-N-acetylglucosamine pyrophosphorylase/glucosamine-1-phosphate N-acetyltransferase
MGKKVMALNVLRGDDILGVNTRQHLSHAATVMQARIQDHWMTEGVTIVDPHNTYIDGRATIGPDTVIYPFSVISGSVKIGSRCRVGPFTHLRDGASLADGVEAGAFVEVSKSHLETGTVVRHLAYLGNATVGRDANIGAGTITANFDGVRKSDTIIGPRARIGSGSILIAPVTVGEDAVVGAGAGITRGTTVEPGDTVVGVPAQSLSSRTNQD